jgi:Cdc6-like AAA superfamily ATPase
MSGGVFTCFAYGQTGSGKTYTMNSVISHAVRHLFEDGSEGTGVPSAEGITLVVSYFEVYMSKASGGQSCCVVV